MDLRTVTAALDRLHQQQPHLPGPDGLARAILTAWDTVTAQPSTSPNGRMLAVVTATWPVGARAGAQRGHRVAADAIRQMLAHALADPPGGADGRWIVWAAVKAADNLPPAPELGEVTTRADGHLPWIGPGENLDVALTLGLSCGWLAGHRDATTRLVEHFSDHITDLVGPDRLTTTFLNAHLTGDDVLRAIETFAYHTAERDQTNPPPDPTRPDAGRAAARAFTPLRLVHTQPTTSPDPTATPPTPPDRPPHPRR